MGEWLQGALGLAALMAAWLFGAMAMQTCEDTAKEHPDAFRAPAPRLGGGKD